MIERAVAVDRPDFTVHHSPLPGRDVTAAYWREGVGGRPLVLLHGFPETKRIWARCVQPLADAGFEVIVPDLRGYGDSSLAPDGHYDIVAYSLDAHALVHDVLGHETCSVVGGDVGGAVLPDLSARFAGFVERQVIFNTMAPHLPELYEAAGIAPDPPVTERPQSDYFVRQGTDADGLIAELATPQLRRSYIRDFYTHRLWGAPGAFTRDDVEWMAVPFEDAARLRAAIAVYESAFGNRQLEAPPANRGPNATPTLILYGPEDHVVAPSFYRRCEVAFPVHVGPFLVPGAGHFLQWERADILVNAVVSFLGAPAQ